MLGTETATPSVERRGEGGCVQVSLGRAKLDELKHVEAPDFGRHLLRMRYVDGLAIYVRRNSNLPGRASDMFFRRSLHGFAVPGYVPSYDTPIDSDYWQEDEDSSAFEPCY